MGLERRTGNEMNWMTVKALGQSALVVMWDSVSRLLLDCNWIVVPCHTFPLALYCWTQTIYMRECNMNIH